MNSLISRDDTGGIDITGAVGTPDVSRLPEGTPYKILEAALVNAAVDSRYFDAYDYNDGDPDGSVINMGRAKALHWQYMTAARTTATAAATVASDQPRLAALAALAESDLDAITDFDALRNYWPECLGERSGQ